MIYLVHTLTCLVYLVFGTDACIHCIQSTEFEGGAVAKDIAHVLYLLLWRVYLDRMVVTVGVLADTKEAALLQAAAADTKPVPELACSALWALAPTGAIATR